MALLFACVLVMQGVVMVSGKCSGVVFHWQDGI